MLPRPAWAEIDLAAIRANAAALATLVAPAQVCAVVKADGYGHGAAPVARAAIEGGATWVGVALVSEGAQLRDAGIEARVLLLSEPPAASFADVVRCRLTPTLYTEAGIQAAARAATGASGTRGSAPLPVHLKVDTGMHRVGAAPQDALALAQSVAARPELALEGLWTHLAVAEELEDPYSADQLTSFQRVRDELEAAGIRVPLVHAANSAAAIALPASRADLVRCGIALYGLAPAPALARRMELRPALSLKATVSVVKVLDAGERLSYGLRYRLERPSLVATVPIGYADGVTRRLSAVGGEVLVGGRRRPIAGTVTMDQLMVDCGDDGEVAPGDEVVLIGRQGGECISADDWAERLDTISYEVVCGIGPRVPRVYLDGT